MATIQIQQTGDKEQRQTKSKYYETKLHNWYYRGKYDQRKKVTQPIEKCFASRCGIVAPARALVDSVSPVQPERARDLVLSLPIVLRSTF